MCIFGTPEPTKVGGPPALAGRVDKDAGELPAKKDIVKPDDVSGVQYGSSKKTSGQSAAGKGGAQDLKIDLNTGGGQSGGINV
jgi:hypothetical protein|tara:strand:- start:172 stop:420 length:249 start_codon:yes stop_codon:yes gene_type:complete